jgi:O-antigen ligase
MKFPSIPFPLNYLLLISIFLVPVAIKMSIFVFLIWFLMLPFNSEKENPLKSNLKIWLAVSLIFIVWQCTGFLFTTNTSNGLFNLQQKLAMLIVPLGIASVKRESLPRFSQITWFLTAGITVYSVVQLFNALRILILTSDLNALNYTRLSPNIHPSYASSYLCLGIVLLIFMLPEIKLWKIKIMAVAALLFFTSFLYLLQSKTGLITSLICLLSAAIWLLRQKTMRGSRFLLILLLACSIWLTQHFLISRNSERMIQAKENIFSNNKKSSNKSLEESSNVRVKIWRISFDLAKDNFLGTGSGDVNDDLRNAYKENNLYNAAKKNLNAHNQYLQIWIGGGYIGLLLFIIWLAVPLNIAFQSRNIPAILLIIMLGLNFLTESMFEAQAGLNFFPLMIAMLLLKPIEKQQNVR